MRHHSSRTDILFLFGAPSSAIRPLAIVLKIDEVARETYAVWEGICVLVFVLWQLVEATKVAFSPPTALRLLQQFGASQIDYQLRDYNEGRSPLAWFSI